MDFILASLNDWQQSPNFAVALPWLRLVCAGLTTIAILASQVSAEDLLAALRQAIKHAGLSDKQVAAEMGVTHGLASLKLHGQRPLTLQAAATLPREVWQWFAVEVASLVGTPRQVRVGLRLRQARMALPHSHKERRA
jgi:hypothetical protein